MKGKSKLLILAGIAALAGLVLAYQHQEAKKQEAVEAAAKAQGEHQYKAVKSIYEAMGK